MQSFRQSEATRNLIIVSGEEQNPSFRQSEATRNLIRVSREE
ncbi:hypothetical protein [Dokdonia sp. Dokd-P16]|nr:hypothetical protein [Dokdonia sp. Dokd-P16]